MTTEARRCDDAEEDRGPGGRACVRRDHFGLCHVQSCQLSDIAADGSDLRFQIADVRRERFDERCAPVFVERRNVERRLLSR